RFDVFAFALSRLEADGFKAVVHERGLHRVGRGRRDNFGHAVGGRADGVGGGTGWRGGAAAQQRGGAENEQAGTAHRKILHRELLYLNVTLRMDSPSSRFFESLPSSLMRSRRSLIESALRKASS